MKLKIEKTQTRLYIITAIILLVGLGSAAMIYLTAENTADSILIHQFEKSKKYRHDLEFIGGKANVLADDFCIWFGGLWHGKSLALISACITILISSGLFFVAYRLPFVPKPEVRHEGNQGNFISKGATENLPHNKTPADNLAISRTDLRESG
jgi:hypothetical protein